METIVDTKMSYEEIPQFIIQKLQEGENHYIVKQLVIDQGFDKEFAERLVDKAIADLEALREVQERLSVKKFLMLLLCGTLLSVLGGAIWATVTVVANLEVGILAIGLGIFSAKAMLLINGGSKAKKLQIMAAFFGVLGIFLGKYMTFVYYLKEAVANDYGKEIAATISAFSFNTILYFFENFQYSFSAFDILWVIFVVTSVKRAYNNSNLSLGRFKSPDLK